MKKEQSVCYLWSTYLEEEREIDKRYLDIPIAYPQNLTIRYVILGVLNYKFLDFIWFQSYTNFIKIILHSLVDFVEESNYLFVESLVDVK